MTKVALCTVSLVLALTFAGCGGGDDETTAGSGSAGATAQQGDGGSQGDSGRQGSGGSGEREPLDTSSLPEPEEGSKKAAPGVPVSRGGDNSIQTWGLEASAQERAEVTAILQAFLDARAAAEWASACSYLAAEQRAEFESLGNADKRGNAACAETMRAFATGVPSSAYDEEAQIDYVLSLRVGEGHAFLIYTRPDTNKIYANALREEDGTWKVVSVGPTVIY
ncbi:MAG TPA: hypothetical protein VNM89_07925 [Solirubrobacterales bacterium]|nr:hypothetical protein [Solirubrobacterales bacterium]